jgi:hypothetical protein
MRVMLSELHEEVRGAGQVWSVDMCELLAIKGTHYCLKQLGDRCLVVALPFRHSTIV